MTFGTPWRRPNEKGWFSLKEPVPYDDALRLLVRELQSCAVRDHTMPPDQRWEVRLHDVITKSIRGEQAAAIEEHGRTERPVTHFDWGEHSAPFYEAAWELVRRGWLTPQFHRTDEYKALVDASAFRVTPVGIEAARSFGRAAVLPVEHDRFLEVLLAHQVRFGSLYGIRCKEAVKAYRFQLHLSCLTMCGAAAEAVLVCLGVEKFGSREKLDDKVLKAQRRSLLRIVSESLKGEQKDMLETLAESIRYWRNDAAHANEREFDEAHCFLALTRLQRLAETVDTEWAEFTHPGGGG